jgi:hypothetical protein
VNGSHLILSSTIVSAASSRFFPPTKDRLGTRVAGLRVALIEPGQAVTFRRLPDAIPTLGTEISLLDLAQGASGRYSASATGARFRYARAILVFIVLVHQLICGIPPLAVDVLMFAIIFAPTP